MSVHGPTVSAIPTLFSAKLAGYESNEERKLCNGLVLELDVISYTRCSTFGPGTGHQARAGCRYQTQSSSYHLSGETKTGRLVKKIHGTT